VTKEGFGSNRKGQLRAQQHSIDSLSYVLSSVFRFVTPSSLSGCIDGSSCCSDKVKDDGRDEWRRTDEPGIGNMTRTRILRHRQNKEMKRATEATWMSALKGYVVLVLMIVLSGLVLRNSQPVTMDFLVSEGFSDLRWVMLGCALLGAIIGYLLATLPLDRSTHREEDPDPASTDRAAGAL
jgi:uncharacterized integral membrane protein